MSGVKVVRGNEIEANSGPHALPGIEFRPAGRALGVTSWGMNLLELAPGCESYPEHDHASDGQEEVYVVLRGSIVFRAEGREHELRAGDFVRVEASIKRWMRPGKDGAAVLAIGGIPGKPFKSML